MRMAGASPERHAQIDVLRGIGIILMVIYHFVWDLAALGFIDPAQAVTPGFRRLGATIASLFLFVSGIALVLARNATSDDAEFRARFLKRLAIIGAAAALVSAGTWLAMGERFVRFGILHSIAFSSVLALPFLRLPRWASFAGAALLLALPWIVDMPVFGQPALLWLGLSTKTPAMVDYVPVFPFAGVALLGVAVGRGLALGPAAPPGRIAGIVARLGRWSLPIYLIHQPVMYGGLFLIASLMTAAPTSGPSVDRDTSAFRTECRRSCESQGTGKEHCDRYCTCAETGMKAGELWRRAMANADMSSIKSELDPMLQACFARSANP